MFKFIAIALSKAFKEKGVLKEEVKVVNEEYLVPFKAGHDCLVSDTSSVDSSGSRAPYALKSWGCGSSLPRFFETCATTHDGEVFEVVFDSDIYVKTPHFIKNPLLRRTRKDEQPRYVKEHHTIGDGSSRVVREWIVEILYVPGVVTPDRSEIYEPIQAQFAENVSDGSNFEKFDPNDYYWRYHYFRITSIPRRRGSVCLREFDEVTSSQLELFQLPRDFVTNNGWVVGDIIQLDAANLTWRKINLAELGA